MKLVRGAFLRPDRGRHFGAARPGVDGTGTWTLALEGGRYGNVYAPGSGSMQFQGAPGRGSVFASGFERRHRCDLRPRATRRP